MDAPRDGAASLGCDDPFLTSLVGGARTWARTDLGADAYGTGSALFDEEWLFGTYMMAAVGLGQHARLCPADAADDIAAAEAALARMLSPAGRAFDTRSWGSDVDARLAEPRGSMALLGYGGLALSVHRAVAPGGPLDATEAAWADALARRLVTPFVETYPGERYPVDNAAGIAALSLHDRITGEDHRAALDGAIAAMKGARDPKTGLLAQSVGPDGSPGPTRGSGTFLTAWFLSRASPELSRALYQNGRDTLAGSVMGLYAMREYPPGVEGTGDIDSGPLLLGFSVSSTGFALGGAAAFGDTTTRDAILRTVHAGGPLALQAVPGLATDGATGTGSALGDAILLAMVTAPGAP